MTLTHKLLNREGFKVRFWIWLCIIFFIVYMVLVALRPQGVFWSVDEGGKFVYFQNVTRSHSFSSPLDYPGRSFDPTGEFYPSYYAIHRENQIYMWWQAAFPIAAGQFYKLFGWLGLYILPALAGVFTLAGVFHLVKELIPDDDRPSLVATVITGIATPIAFYSTMFWEHTLTTMGVIFACFSILRAVKTRQTRWIIAAGAGAALAVFFRVESILLLVGFGVVLLLNNWRFGVQFGFSFLVFLLPLVYIHTQLTGTPFTPMLSQVVEGDSFRAAGEFGMNFFAYLLFNPPAVWTLELPRSLTNLATVSIIVVIVGTLIKPLRWVGIAGTAVLLGIPVWILLSPSGYRSLHGLITASPVIVFSLWMLAQKQWWKSSLFSGMLVAGIFITLIGYIYKSWVGAGGLQWGPRYLLSFYPLLVSASIIGLYSIWPKINQFMRIAIVSLFLLSVITGLGFEIRGQNSVHTIQLYYQQSKTAYQQKADRPIITAWCDIVYLIPDLYWDQVIFSVTRSGLDRWAEHAGQMGIEKFYVANLDLCTPDFLDKVAQERLKNPSGLTIIPFSTADYPSHEKR